MSLVKLKYLPDNTLFHVNNGNYDAYITSENGKRVCYCGIVNKSRPTEYYVKKVEISNDFALDINILSLGREYIFDVEFITEELIQWIRDWFEENGSTCKAVLGISGGKDSTIAAALCVEALGRDRVIGVLLPNGEQSDINDAIDVCSYLGIDNYIINIKEGVDATYKELERCGLMITEQAYQNTPPRERTKNIRAICQCVNGRMVNTCNLSEDYIGYFTIGGDGEGDFAPLANLTVTEVIEIGHFLGLPDYLVDKTPADGLCGKSDEDNFGFTYKVLDKYIRTGICDDEIRCKIDARHKANLFKLRPRASFKLLEV